MSFFGLCLALVGMTAGNFSASANQANAIFTFENLFDATFSDTSSGGVTLTFKALNAGSGLDGLYFNLDPSLNASSLVFNQTGLSGNTFAGYSVASKADAFKVDGSGKYDIKFTFQNNPIIAGDSISFAITGIVGLTASDFYLVSTECAGGTGANYGSAILTGVDGRPVTVLDGALLNIVPDNFSSAILLGMAMLSVETLRRKTRKALKA